MNTPSAHRFASILKRERRRRGWTQNDLAEKLNIDANTVSRWERGSHMPFPVFHEKLCRLFDMDIEALGLLDEKARKQLGVLLCYAQADEPFMKQLKADLELRDIHIWHHESGELLIPEQMPGRSMIMLESFAVVIVASPETSTSPSVREALLLAEQVGWPLRVLWVAGDRRRETLPAMQSSVRVFDFIDARKTRYQQALDELLIWLHTLPSFVGNKTSLAPVSIAASESRNPYKGLRAFHLEDARDFFGRDHLIDVLMDALELYLAQAERQEGAARFLAIIGPSGSGKSSVALAGLLPRLHLGELSGSSQWIYLSPIVPGKHPLEALATALGPAFPQRSLHSLVQDLAEEGARGLHLLTTQLAVGQGTKVVLLVDQFEEIFTQTTDELERKQFIELLVTASSESSGVLLLILTLRADFYDQPMYYPSLGMLFERQSKSIFPLSIQELRAAIEKPAAQPDVRVVFERHLIDFLITDVQQQSGALPLLQFVLEQLFCHRSGQSLTMNAYHDIGGVAGALAQHAEAAYLGLPSDEHRTLAQHIFLRLIDPGGKEHEMTRRRAGLWEFSYAENHEKQLVSQVIDSFITARLFTASEHVGKTTIEISHEALMREWPRLMTWLREAQQDIELQQALSRSAAAWDEQRKSRDHLYRGSQLKAANVWAKRSRPSQKELAFLRASNFYRLQALVSVMAISLLLISTIGLTGWLFLQLPVDATRVTTLNDSGPGSLLQAIQAAPSGSTITFGAPIHGTLLFTHEDLTITRNLVIQGPGADRLVLSSGSSGHRIQVSPGHVVSVIGLTLGSSLIQSGNFIQNDGTLQLIACVISNITVTGSGAASIYNTGELTLSNSQVARNTTMAASINNRGILTLIRSAVTQNQGGGGILNAQGRLIVFNSNISENRATNAAGGGGIYNEGIASLTDTVISGNTIINGSGGGIYNVGGTLTLSNSTVQDNITKHGYGGGIENQATLNIVHSVISGNTDFNDEEPHRGGGGIYTSDMLTMTASSVTHNTLVTNQESNGSGGGIYNSGEMIASGSAFWDNTVFNGIGGGIANEHLGKLTLTNSTIAENRALDSSGGGLSVLEGRVNLTFCTIYGNTAHDSGGGIYIIEGNSIRLTNSLVAQNQAHQGSDIAGTVISGGYNLIQIRSGASVIVPDVQRNTDLFGVERTPYRLLCNEKSIRRGIPEMILQA